MRSLLVAALLLASLPAAAKVAPTTLRELTTSADAIVVGRVVDVVQHGDVRFARVRVERALKGAVDAHVAVVASPTWVCDTTNAQQGERAVLFLQAASPATTTDGLRAPPALAADRLYTIAWSGRGHMTLVGDDLVEIDPSVRVPKRLPMHRLRGAHVGRAPLAALLVAIEGCVPAKGATEGARCDDGPTASIFDAPERRAAPKPRAASVEK